MIIDHCTSTCKIVVVRTCPRPQDEGQGTGDDFEVVDPSQLLAGPLEAAEQEAKHDLIFGLHFST